MCGLLRIYELYQESSVPGSKHYFNVHTTCTDITRRKQTQIEFYRISDIQQASKHDSFGFYMIEILTFDRLIWYVVLKVRRFFVSVFLLHEEISN